MEALAVCKHLHDGQVEPAIYAHGVLMTVIHDELTDYVSLLSSAKAEALFGFRARHSWRSYGLEAA